VRRLITATSAGFAAAALAFLFGVAGPALAQTGSGSGETSSTVATTATTAFTGSTAAASTLANTGTDTWVLVSGAGLATAGAVAARRLLRHRTS
jgi:hypothetical protein